MDRLLSASLPTLAPDPNGSLIDSDMGAWLHVAQPAAAFRRERSSFLVWFEEPPGGDGGRARLPGGTESAARTDIAILVGGLPDQSPRTTRSNSSG